MLELEENLHRKDLTAHERSKAMVETAKATAVVITEERKAKPVSPASGETSKGGRPSKGGVAVAAVAERMGKGEQTIVDAERHVAIADRYPLLAGPDWSQRAAVKVGKMLDELPAKERNRITKLVERSGAHATVAGGRQRARPRMRPPPASHSSPATDRGAASKWRTASSAKL